MVPFVDKALTRLESRAGEIGKPLHNRYATKLHGCKEIKLRQAGVRIVLRVTNETVDISADRLYSDDRPARSDIVFHRVMDGGTRGA